LPENGAFHILVRVKNNNEPGKRHQQRYEKKHLGFYGGKHESNFPLDLHHVKPATTAWASGWGMSAGESGAGLLSRACKFPAVRR
jgi:hypothetical protein